MVTLDQAQPTQSETFKTFKSKFLSLNNLKTKETMNYFQQYRKEVNAQKGDMSPDEIIVIKDIVALKYNDITTGTNTASEKYLTAAKKEAVEKASTPKWGVTKNTNVLDIIQDPAPTTTTTKTTWPVEVKLPPAVPPQTDAQRVAEAHEEIDKENFKEEEPVEKLDDSEELKPKPTTTSRKKTKRNGGTTEEETAQQVEVSPRQVTQSGIKFTISRRINLPVNGQAYTNNEASFSIEGEDIQELLNFEDNLIRHELLKSLDINKYLSGEKKMDAPNFTQADSTTQKKNERFKNFMLDLYADNLTSVTTDDGSQSLGDYIKNRFATFADKNPIQ